MMGWDAGRCGKNGMLGIFITTVQVHRANHGFNEGDFFVGEGVFGIEVGVGPGAGEVLEGGESKNT